MNAALHSRLVEAASRRDDLAIDLANYRTAWQLSLDANLDGVMRREWAALADAAAYRLCTAINNGLPPKVWPFGMGSF